MWATIGWNTKSRDKIGCRQTEWDIWGLVSDAGTGDRPKVRYILETQEKVTLVVWHEFYTQKTHLGWHGLKKQGIETSDSHHGQRE